MYGIIDTTDLVPCVNNSADESGTAPIPVVQQVPHVIVDDVEVLVLVDVFLQFNLTLPIWKPNTQEAKLGT